MTKHFSPTIRQLIVIVSLAPWLLTACDSKPVVNDPVIDVAEEAKVPDAVDAVEVTSNAADGVSKKPTADSPDDDVLTVMTWNLEWFFDDAMGDNYSKLAKEKSTPSRAQWDWRRDAIADAIAQVRPSVLAMQEVEGQKVLYYLHRAIERRSQIIYEEFAVEGGDYYTEQDVGFLVRRPVDVLSIGRGNLTSAMRDSKQFGSVTKHMIAILEVPVGETRQRVVIVNLHLRAGADSDELRANQIGTLNQWLTMLYPEAGAPESESNGMSPVHLIVLGDFNTEQSADNVRADSELGLMMSRGTPTPTDDLIDLHTMIPADERQTHLNAGKQFDRILVSRSLVDDQPGIADLTLRDVAVRRDVAIQSGADQGEDHWDKYWELGDDERDLSDHYPVVARFVVQ